MRRAHLELRRRLQRLPGVRSSHRLDHVLRPWYAGTCGGDLLATRGILRLRKELRPDLRPIASTMFGSYGSISLGLLDDAEGLPPLRDRLRRDAPPEADRLIGFPTHRASEGTIDDQGSIRVASNAAQGPGDAAVGDRHDHDVASAGVVDGLAVAESRRGVGAVAELVAVVGPHALIMIRPEVARHRQSQ